MHFACEYFQIIYSFWIIYVCGIFFSVLCCWVGPNTQQNIHRPRPSIPSKALRTPNSVPTTGRGLVVSPGAGVPTFCVVTFPTGKNVASLYVRLETKPFLSICNHVMDACDIDISGNLSTFNWTALQNIKLNYRKLNHVDANLLLEQILIDV